MTNLSSFWGRVISFLSAGITIIPKTVDAVESTVKEQDTLLTEIAKNFNVADYFVTGLSLVLVAISIAGSLQKLVYYWKDQKEKAKKNAREILKKKKILILSSNDHLRAILRRVFERYGVTNGEYGNIKFDDVDHKVEAEGMYECHVIIIDFDSSDKSEKFMKWARSEDSDVIIIGISKNKLKFHELNFSCLYPVYDSHKIVRKISKLFNE
jgi:hypothetical protein